MPCYSPVTIPVKKLRVSRLSGVSIKHYVQVPCGHCLGCLKVRQMQFAFRAEWEAVDPRNKMVVFCTFTYAPEFLPFGNELSKDEVQRYIRRLKKALPGVSVRYLFCGEHGELYKRAHYHAILYFSDIVPYSVIFSAWSKGIVDIAPFTAARAGYVAKYSVKQLGDNSDDWFVPPFLMISNTLGFFFLDRYGEYCRKHFVNSWMNSSGFYVPLPRVFMERLFPPMDSAHFDIDPYSAKSIYMRAFVGKRFVLTLKRKASYDARVSCEATKKGLSVSVFQGVSEIGLGFVHEKKVGAIFNRVFYETGRYTKCCP